MDKPDPSPSGASAANARSAILLDAIERNQELLSIIERALVRLGGADAETLLVNVRGTMSMNGSALKMGGRAS